MAFTHGTQSGYNKHRCRCPECREAVSNRKPCRSCGARVGAGVWLRGCCSQECLLRFLGACESCGAQLDRPSQRRFCSHACAASAQRGTGRGARPASKTDRDWRSRDAAGLTECRRRSLLAKWRARGVKCAYCGGLTETVDHVIPLIRGGDNFEGNLAPACRKCNASKCDWLIVEWRHRRGSGSSVQRPWRAPARPAKRKPKEPRPEKPCVQACLSICAVCQRLFDEGGRVTCGSPHCQREWAGRATRDRYRRLHGIPVDASEPTAYWRRLIEAAA